MSCSQHGVIECSTSQIIEPLDEFLVDTAGTASDVDERGEQVLTDGQPYALVNFTVPKVNASFNFEYLYVSADGIPAPGAISCVPVIRSAEGFVVAFAGTPIGTGYVLHWRVTIVRTGSLAQIDAPEDIRIQIPRQKSFAVNFTNPRSTTAYGFTELTVENLIDSPDFQTPIHIQVYSKLTFGVGFAVNPIPPTNNYFLRIRTP